MTGEKISFALTQVKWIQLQQPAERVHFARIDPRLAQLFHLSAHPRVIALRWVIRFDTHAGLARLVDARAHLLRAVAGGPPFGEVEITRLADVEQSHAAGARNLGVFGPDREHQAIQLLFLAEGEE